MPVYKANVPGALRTYSRGTGRTSSPKKFLPLRSPEATLSPQVKLESWLEWPTRSLTEHDSESVEVGSARSRSFVSDKIVPLDRDTDRQRRQYTRISRSSSRTRLTRQPDGSFEDPRVPALKPPPRLASAPPRVSLFALGRCNTVRSSPLKSFREVGKQASTTQVCAPQPESEASRGDVRHAPDGSSIDVPTATPTGKVVNSRKVSALSIIPGQSDRPVLSARSRRSERGPPADRSFEAMAVKAPIFKSPPRMASAPPRVSPMSPDASNHVRLSPPKSFREMVKPAPTIKPNNLQEEGRLRRDRQCYERFSPASSIDSIEVPSPHRKRISARNLATSVLSHSERSVMSARHRRQNMNTLSRVSQRDSERTMGEADSRFSFRCHDAAFDSCLGTQKEKVIGLKAWPTPLPWRAIVEELTQFSLDASSKEALLRFRTFAVNAEAQLRQHLEEERASKVDAERNSMKVARQPIVQKVAQIRKIEQRLVQMQAYEEYEAVKREADELEHEEIHEAEEDMRCRLARVDEYMFLREHDASEGLERELYDKLWEKALAEELPSSMLDAICASLWSA